MLKLLEYDSTNFKTGIVLGDACDVRVTHEINGENMLEFTYPLNEKSALIHENMIVVCEGQAYRITKASAVKGEKSSMQVECRHVYNADAPNIHIQNIPDMIGVYPTNVIKAAIEGTKFSFMSDSELEKLGMRRVDYDGFKIDFFSTDKTNPYDVVKTVIENCGKGEIYADNYKIALVERIGSDTKIRLDVTKNLQDITIERDITDMVTRLYPYGKDDAHIGSVNNGVQYIQSGNAAIYGVREGYRDYTDYIEPDKIMSRAMWEFDSENSERIDVPCVNITGTFADISKLSEYGDAEKINLGDGVTVIDNGNEIKERIIKLEYYPYQSDSTVLSIGRVKKDLFFYLEQMGTLVRRYKKVSTTNGKVKASSVSGTIKDSGISVTNSDGALSILSDIIQIFNRGQTMVRLGNADGKFMCSIADNNGNTAIELGEDGKMNFKGKLNSEQIILGDNIIEVNEDGKLCLNGHEIVTVE